MKSTLVFTFSAAALFSFITAYGAETRTYIAPSPKLDSRSIELNKVTSEALKKYDQVKERGQCPDPVSEPITKPDASIGLPPVLPPGFPRPGPC